MPGPKSLHAGRGYIQVGKRAVRILLECFLVNFVGNHEYTTDRFLKMNCNFLHFIFDKSVQKISLQYICSYKILQGFQILS